MSLFKCHCWFVFGAAVGVTVTALFGWPTGCGWLTGYGLSMGVIYAFADGYLRVDRKGRA